MKFLKIICFTFFTALLFYSCSKEYSLETPITAPGTWQFNDSTTLFTGNIDTAFIETAGTTKTLTLTGPSLDGKQLFLLHLSATDSFTVGTYKASLSQSDFEYFTQAKTIYQADQLTGEFIVNITAIGNSKIAGTFSGIVADSSGKIKQITKGLFSSAINLAGNGSGGGTGNGIASGTLGSSSGTCTSATLAGSFTQGIALTSSNTVQVQVTIATPGTYTISTNTVNGVAFVSSGTFTTAGAQNVILTGSGIPVNSGSQTFAVTFGSSTCNFSVTFIAGTPPASGTLGGSPGACTTATPAGIYTQGITLTSANTIQIQVNVTTIGAYNISTNTNNGVTFSGAGTFTTTGVQNVILTGSGTPLNSGSQTFTVTFGTSNCNFSINFIAPPQAVGTLGASAGSCTSTVFGGTYTQGTVLNSSNTVQVQVNVTVAGVYNITTNNVNGVSFSGSGTFTTTGLQNVVLKGSGTPVNSGSQTFTVTFGTSTCNFPITFSAISAGVYNCKIDGVFTDFTDRAQAEINDSGTPYLYLNGFTAPPNGATVPEFQIFIKNNNSSTVTPGTYDETHLLSQTGGYRIEIDYTGINADNSVTIWNTASSLFTPSPHFIITVTSISTSRVKGTFSGKLTNTLQGSTLFKTITEGVFDLPIK